MRLGPGPDSPHAELGADRSSLQEECGSSLLVAGVSARLQHLRVRTERPGDPGPGPHSRLLRNGIVEICAGFIPATKRRRRDAQGLADGSPADGGVARDLNELCVRLQPLVYPRRAPDVV